MILDSWATHPHISEPLGPVVPVHNRNSAAKHAETHFVVLLRLLLRFHARSLGRSQAPIAQDGDDWIVIASPNRVNDYTAGSHEWICIANA